MYRRYIHRNYECYYIIITAIVLLLYTNGDNSLYPSQLLLTVL